MCLYERNKNYSVRKLIYYSNKNIFDVIFYWRILNLQHLNAIVHDFCLFFGDVTIDVNGKVGFLNFRGCDLLSRKIFWHSKNTHKSMVAKLTQTFYLLIISVDAYKFAFFPSGMMLWNSLSTETVSAQSLESFKTLIMDWCPQTRMFLTSFRCTGLHACCHVPVKCYCASMLQRSPAHYW